MSVWYANIDQFAMGSFDGVHEAYVSMETSHFRSVLRPDVVWHFESVAMTTFVPSFKVLLASTRILLPLKLPNLRNSVPPASPTDYEPLNQTIAP